MTASCAVCPEHPEKHHFGIKVAPSAGVNLNVEASEDDDESEPFLSKAIAVCTPFIPIAFVHGLWLLMILIAPSLSRCLSLPCVPASVRLQTQRAPRERL